MNKKTKYGVSLVSVIVIIALAAVLVWRPWQSVSAPSANSSAASDNSSTPTQIGAGQLIEPTYDEDDVLTTYDASSAITIALSDSGSTSSSSSVSILGSAITLKSAGTYVISGTLSAGQIVVSAGDNDRIHLIFNGVTLTSKTSAALYITNADKTVITLNEGTVNTLSDASVYTGANSDDEPSAALFSKTDLTINGTGTLVVTGNYEHGIQTKDDLKLISGTYQITAVQDAIRGRDSITIKDGTYHLVAGNDGLKSNNDEDTEKGWIAIESGTFDIVSVYDGIQAETVLQIGGGQYSITTNAGVSSSYSSASESAKGLKSGTALLVIDGQFNLNTYDDAVHSNGNIEIRGGMFTISTSDDAVHSDATLTVSGGSLAILQSYEGLEGKDVIISGGEISIKASDDGINAAGGSDGTSSNGRPDNFASSGNSSLTISGGLVYVDASGDGLDANGNLTISGGTVLVNGPTSNGDGALDYDGTGSISGGVVIAVGSSGMAQGFGSSSTQASMGAATAQTYAAGTIINVTNADGEVLITFKAAKAFSSIIVSTPEMALNGTYSISVGGAATGAQSYGLYTDATYSGGSIIATETLTSMATSSMTGTQGQGGQGGQGGPGQGGSRP